MGCVLIGVVSSTGVGAEMILAGFPTRPIYRCPRRAAECPPKTNHPWLVWTRPPWLRLGGASFRFIGWWNFLCSSLLFFVSLLSNTSQHSALSIFCRFFKKIWGALLAKVELVYESSRREYFFAVPVRYFGKVRNFIYCSFTFERSHEAFSFSLLFFFFWILSSDTMIWTRVISFRVGLAHFLSSLLLVFLAGCSKRFSWCWNGGGDKIKYCSQRIGVPPSANIERQ